MLAAPAAGLVMVWGLPAGVAAGLSSAGVASVLHAPSRALLAWIAWVAARSAGGPALGAMALVSLTAALVVLLGAGRAARRGTRGALRVAALFLAAAALVPALHPAPRVPGHTEPSPGAELWRGSDTTVLVVHDGVDPEASLRALRSERVRSVDAIVAVAGADPGAVTALRRRYPRAALVDAGRLGAGQWCVGDVEVAFAGGRVTARLAPGGACGTPR
jgi:hypothetical protein